jgi:hypothetical protein
MLYPFELRARDHGTADSSMARDATADLATGASCCPASVVVSLAVFCTASVSHSLWTAASRCCGPGVVKFRQEVTPMRRIPGGLVAVPFLLGLAQAQQSAASLSPSTKVETHLLPPPHSSVTTTVVSLSEQFEGPHWWNDHGMYHDIYSHSEVPNVAMLNRDGTIAFKTTLTASNLDRIHVTDAAATVDGARLPPQLWLTKQAGQRRSSHSWTIRGKSYGRSPRFHSCQK